jgi:hypothetical protein
MQATEYSSDRDRNALVAAAEAVDLATMEADACAAGPGRYEGASDLSLVVALDILASQGGADEEAGEADVLGHAARFGRFILHTDSQGFREARVFTDESRAQAAMEDYVPDVEPSEDDAFLSSCGQLGAKTRASFIGKDLGEFDEEADAEAAIRAEGNRSGFFPNVWRVSDHGNSHLCEDWTWSQPVEPGEICDVCRWAKPVCRCASDEASTLDLALGAKPVETPPTVPCGLCGAPTSYTRSQECADPAACNRRVSEQNALAEYGRLACGQTASDAAAKASAKDEASTLSRRIEAASKAAATLYAEGKDTTDADAVVDALTLLWEAGRESMRVGAAVTTPEPVQVPAPRRGEAIYSDDADALPKLRAKVARLEAERANAKQRNAEYRKAHRAELKAMTAYQRDMVMPFRAYVGQNLSGLITTTRKRIEQLEREHDAE